MLADLARRDPAMVRPYWRIDSAGLRGSELSHLNLLAGERCMVSATMLELLTLADAYRQLTDGIFNPFILDTLLKCGYNESFERIIHKHENDDRMSPGEPARDELASRAVLIPATKSSLLMPR